MNENPLNCGFPTDNPLTWAYRYGTEMEWNKSYSVDSDLMFLTVKPTALTGVYSLKHDASETSHGSAAGAHAYVDFQNGEIGFYKATTKLASETFTFVANHVYEIQHTVMNNNDLALTVTDTQTKESATVKYDAKNGAYYSRALGLRTHGCSDSSVVVLSSKLYSLQPYNAQALIMGDSYVADFHKASQYPRYATLIKNELNGSAFINGISGGTTTDIIESLEYLTDLCSPRYFILGIGTNQSNFSTWEREMNTIINTVKTTWPEAQIILNTITFRCDKNCDPELGSTNPYNASFVNQANNWIRNSGYKYIDINRLTTVGNDMATWDSSKFQSDKVHLTEAAYGEVFEEYKTVVPELFAK